MKWADVGDWLKDNSGGLLGLAGSIATGNIPGGVAAVASMIGEATGENSPAGALKKLQTDPATMIRLKELAKQDEASIRQHHKDMLELQFKNEQSAHAEQQKTIQSGDNAQDAYVRKTRPQMARQSWYATMVYVVVLEMLKAFNITDTGASFELAGALASPALAYMGFRTLDKFKGVVKK